MTVTASQVKELREKTGAGMMDCKKALNETNGDFEAAVDWLRTKGLAAAAKKAGNVAAEGSVAIAVSGNVAAAVEINSQTDFVARNEQFQSLVKEVAEAALKCNSVEELKSATLANGKTVEAEVIEKVAVIGENLNLRRMNRLEVSNGVIATYVHNEVIPNQGRIAVLIALESTADKAALLALGKQLAMHAAAARPVALDETGVDESLVARERDIFTEQARASGKPDNIIEKMIVGRIRKFYEEVCLLNQIFVMDNKTPIAEVLAAKSKELGAPITLKAFARLEVGEGIEKQESDFASEVAAAAGTK